VAKRETRHLVIELLDTWHVGTGRSRGQHLDAVVERDAQGLPFLPGRTLRGLLRDAAECLAAWGHVSEATLHALFGELSDVEGPGPSVRSRPGALRLSDARLSPELAAWLAAPGNASLRQALYLESFQTAIDPKTGVPKPHTLRGIELTVPLSLQAELEVVGLSEAQTQEALQLLAACLPLVRAVGAHTSRGHGRAQISFQEAA
jgi:hypothetical protein